MIWRLSDNLTEMRQTGLSWKTQLVSERRLTVKYPALTVHEKWVPKSATLPLPGTSVTLPLPAHTEMKHWQIFNFQVDWTSDFKVPLYPFPLPQWKVGTLAVRFADGHFTASRRLAIWFKLFHDTPSNIGMKGHENSYSGGILSDNRWFVCETLPSHLTIQTV